MRVLVLEDDVDLRDSLTAFLAMVADAQCVSAESVPEVERLGPVALQTELALLDINLGAGQPSGIDAYAWLRGHGYRGRIVFITGHASGHPLVDEARRIGGADVLSKPVPLERLTELVRAGTS